MAFLNDDERMKQEQEQQGQGGVALAQAPGLVGGGQAQGKGTGGATGWTNIQSYLDANKGSTASADYLNQTLGGAFDAEKSKADAETSKIKSDGDAAASKAVGTDQASSLLAQASSKYVPQNSLTEAAAPIGNANAALEKLKTGTSIQYGGPAQYNYAMSQPVQDYGKNLQSDSGFQAIMNALYDKSGTRSPGRKSLQMQLDQENTALNAARGGLKDKFAGLQSDIQAKSQAADASARAGSSAAQSAQKLKDYLMGEADKARGAGNYASWNAINDVLGLGGPMEAPKTPAVARDNNIAGGAAPSPVGPVPNAAGGKTFENVQSAAPKKNPKLRNQSGAYAGYY